MQSRFLVDYFGQIKTRVNYSTAQELQKANGLLRARYRLARRGSVCIDPLRRAKQNSRFAMKKANVDDSTKIGFDDAWPGHQCNMLPREPEKEILDSDQYLGLLMGRTAIRSAEWLLIKQSCAMPLNPLLFCFKPRYDYGRFGAIKSQRWCSRCEDRFSPENSK